MSRPPSQMPPDTASGSSTKFQGEALAAPWSASSILSARMAFSSSTCRGRDGMIQTTLVGSYPVPQWLLAHPTDQGLRDATAVVLHMQELAGIDLPVDGELYRFNPNHPETNGMIEYFVQPMDGIRTSIRRSDTALFRSQ